MTMIKIIGCQICGDDENVGTIKIDEKIRHFLSRILHISFSKWVKLFQDDQQEETKDSSLSGVCGSCSELIMKGENYQNEITQFQTEIDGMRFQILDKLINIETPQNNLGRYLLVNKIKTCFELELPQTNETTQPQNNNDGINLPCCVICEKRTTGISDDKNRKKLVQILCDILKISHSSENESSIFCGICSILLTHGQDCLKGISFLESKLVGVQFQLLKRLEHDKNRYNLLEMIKSGLKLTEEEKESVSLKNEECSKDVEMETQDNSHDELVSTTAAPIYNLNNNQNKEQDFEEEIPILIHKDDDDVVANEQNMKIINNGNDDGCPVVQDFAMEHSLEQPSSSKPKQDNESKIDDQVVHHPNIDDDDAEVVIVDEIHPHYNNVGFLMCILCDEIFTNHQKLGKHYKDPSPLGHGNPSVWRCNGRNCFMKFQSRIGLYHHRRSFHKNLPINQWNKSWIGRPVAAKKKQQKKRGMVVICVLCNAVFGHKAEITQHYKSVHPNTSEWPCFFCPKVYKSRLALYHHRRYAHKEEFEESIAKNKEKGKDPNRNLLFKNSLVEFSHQLEQLSASSYSAGS